MRTRAQHGIYSFFSPLKILQIIKVLTAHTDNQVVEEWHSSQWQLLIAIMRVHSWSCIHNQYVGVSVNIERQILFWLPREGKQLKIFLILSESLHGVFHLYNIYAVWESKRAGEKPDLPFRLLSII
jgi:hypothetical protein